MSGLLLLTKGGKEVDKRLFVEGYKVKRLKCDITHVLCNGNEEQGPVACQHYQNLRHLDGIRWARKCAAIHVRQKARVNGPHSQRNARGRLW